MLIKKEDATIKTRTKETGNFNKLTRKNIISVKKTTYLQPDNEPKIKRKWEKKLQ